MQELVKAIRVIDCGEDVKVLFHYPSGTLFRINDKVAKMIKMFIKNQPSAKIAHYYGVPVSEINFIFSHIEKIVNKNGAIPIWVKEEDDRNLGKLVLLNTDCNFRCKYCYAGGGSYGMNRAIMSAKTGVDVLRQAYSYFSYIDKIMFFGGEPLLNLNLIESVCKYINELFVTCAIHKKPEFGLVTNLSILPEEFVRLVTDYQIHVTVSLDGPKHIHDQLRTYPDGKGTFSRVADNIHKLRKRTREPSAIEATYTRIHAENGYDNEKLKEFFFREFGIQICMIYPVTLPKGHPFETLCCDFKMGPYVSQQLRSLFRDFTENGGGCSEFAMLVPYVGFINRTVSDYYCPAGIDLLAVAPDGDIYPCYHFVGKREFYMGNAINTEGFGSLRFLEIRRRFLENRKSSAPSCKKCWARIGLCKTCLGNNYAKIRSLRPVDDHAFCVGQKIIAKTFLKEVALLSSNSDKWQKFLSRLREYALQVLRTDTDASGN